EMLSSRRLRAHSFRHARHDHCHERNDRLAPFVDGALASMAATPHRKGPPMAAKRELISPNGDKRFIRRDEQGRIVESDDVGKSLAQDVRKAAKTTAKPGQGDKGDRKR